ncbi:MAG TPA: hypothetical protein VK923_08905 [Euzebyales bacterium]|nr:hypothetical protein [Euzebyales bacterium]
MPEVVELRVHGVGGGSPESLLGVEERETVRVAGEGPTGFWARRSQRSVEGYWWGRLTSAPLLQPLWIVLLPFTLLNVAGWMHQPLDERTTPTRSWWAVRWVLMALGYLLTAVYAAWSGVLVIDLLLIEWRLGGRWGYSTAGLAAVAAVVALGIVFLVARHVQGGFEDRQPPPGVVDATEELREAPTDDPRALFAGERDLAAPSFWMHGSSARTMLLTHTLVAAAVLLAPCVRAVVQMATGVAAGLGTLGYDVVVAWLLRAVVVGLVVLAVLTVVERVVFERAKRRAPDRYVMTRRSGFRVCAQAVAVAFAVALAVGGFSGIERLLRARIAAPESANRDLDVAFGVAAIVFSLVVVWRLVVHARRKAQIRAELLTAATQRADDDGRRQVSAAMLNRVAWARSLSEVLRNIDLVLSIPALCFLAAAVVAITGVTGSVPWGNEVAALGGTIILVSMSTILVFLWREGRRTGVRRQVGMIWDVLTFWPRRTHPWAIRPYSERAVPELQERLCHHLGRDRYVILSAHSQGTVLAVAALAQLMGIESTAAGRVALVTYGSPVAQLYQRFFPAYFHLPLTFDLYGQLCDGEISSDMAWRNFFRATDYVGKALFTGTELATVDRMLDDPALQPVIDELPLADGVPGGPDPIREAFSALALHSDYSGEVELRAWVDQLRHHLGGGHTDVADAPGEVLSPR